MSCSCGTKARLVLVGDIFTVGVMVPILALMGEVTLFFMQTKLKTSTLAILQFALLGRAFTVGVPFLTWKRPIFRILLENSFLGFF
jgi:hypothetical protein